MALEEFFVNFESKGGYNRLGDNLESSHTGDDSEVRILKRLLN
ncbi:hypothetical protein ES703_99789 [subsurface metagenome]